MPSPKRGDRAKTSKAKSSKREDDLALGTKPTPPRKRKKKGPTFA